MGIFRKNRKSVKSVKPEGIKITEPVVQVKTPEVKKSKKGVIAIEGTDDHPTIYLDSDTKNPCFEISGKSLPEDVVGFYEPIIEWLTKYSKNPLPKTELKIKLEYFNTATSKMLLDIFVIFEELYEKEHDVVINWHYPSDDEDIEEAGEEYDEIVDCPFKLISYEVY